MSSNIDIMCPICNAKIGSKAANKNNGGASITCVPCKKRIEVQYTKEGYLIKNIK